MRAITKMAVGLVTAVAMGVGASSALADGNVVQVPNTGCQGVFISVINHNTGVGPGYSLGPDTAAAVQSAQAYALSGGVTCYAGH
jgi:hypothetical protein